MSIKTSDDFPLTFQSETPQGTHERTHPQATPMISRITRIWNNTYKIISTWIYSMRIRSGSMIPLILGLIVVLGLVLAVLSQYKRSAQEQRLSIWYIQVNTSNPAEMSLDSKSWLSVEIVNNSNRGSDDPLDAEANTVDEKKQGADENVFEMKQREAREEEGKKEDDEEEERKADSVFIAKEPSDKKEIKGLAVDKLTPAQQVALDIRPPQTGKATASPQATLVTDPSNTEKNDCVPMNCPPSFARSVIILTNQPRAGFSDRTTVLDRVSNMASYLCATMITLKPCYMLKKYGKTGHSVKCDIGWSAFFHFTSTRDAQESAFNLTGVGSKSLSETTILSELQKQSRWPVVRISRKLSISDQFEQARKAISQQSLFVWTIDRNFYRWRQDLHHHLNRAVNGSHHQFYHGIHVQGDVSHPRVHSVLKRTAKDGNVRRSPLHMSPQLDFMGSQGCRYVRMHPSHLVSYLNSSFIKTFEPKQQKDQTKRMTSPWVTLSIRRHHAAESCNTEAKHVVNFVKCSLKKNAKKIEKILAGASNRNGSSGTNPTLILVVFSDDISNSFLVDLVDSLRQIGLRIILGDRLMLHLMRGNHLLIPKSLRQNMHLAHAASLLVKHVAPISLEMNEATCRACRNFH